MLHITKNSNFVIIISAIILRLNTFIYFIIILNEYDAY